MTEGAILLLAPDRSYRTAAYVHAATSLDIPLVVAAWGAADLSLPGQGIRIDSSSDESALKTIREVASHRRFIAALPTDDSTVALCQKAAEMLDLPANAPEAVEASTNKLIFRELCRDAGVATPSFQRVQINDTSKWLGCDVGFPCVVKPMSLSASRGVIRCDDLNEVRAALARIQALLSEEESSIEKACIIEDFIPGREFAIEALVCAGELDVLAIFEKPDPLDGPFFEETIYITPPRLEPIVIEDMIRQLESICRAIGLLEGPIHAEVRVNDKGVWFLELASRTIGGRCGRVVEYQTGYPLEQLVLLNACRGQRQPGRRSGASGVMMIPVRERGVLRRVEGINRARSIPGVIDVEVDVREGHLMRPWPEGSAYPGFIFAGGATSEFVEGALRDAEAELRFIVAPEFNVKTN
ncbi:MAG: ATP-grasp domain-containing protein [Gammaproteobacteria bacterium]|nr:ATP-grasp domain-containing protein [Gammaproteobacteria bacterium]NDG43663.1 ATP-grasp domain-containing protein [Gammaproteobacteria bacterium]